MTDQFNTNIYNYTSSSEIPAGYLSELQTLRDQWEQTVGYSINIPDSWLAQAANANVSDIESFGQWALNENVLGGTEGKSWWSNYPWAAYGMTSNQYITMMGEYSEQWTALTGQAPQSWTFANYFNDPLQNGLTATEAAAQWQNNAAMQAAYPWLKYGMNYNQFTAQKQTMDQNFGYQLSDSQAAQQLEYFHTNAGTNNAANVEPTFSQIEKKQAEVGTSGPGSVVR